MKYIKTVCLGENLQDFKVAENTLDQETEIDVAIENTTNKPKLNVDNKEEIEIK